MRRNIFAIGVAAIVLCGALTAFAQDKKDTSKGEPPKVEAAKSAAAKVAAEKGDAPKKDKADALEPMRKLAGEWTGEAGGEEKQPVTVIYRVTAAGSAVSETLFAGTPHEMVTMYYLDGGDLVLTHYCAAGNQPKMKAVKSDDPKVIKFDFAGGTNIDPAKDMHMHSAVLKFIDENTLEADWQSMDGGKPGHSAKFQLKRKKA